MSYYWLGFYANCSTVSKRGTANVLLYAAFQPVARSYKRIETISFIPNSIRESCSGIDGHGCAGCVDSPVQQENHADGWCRIT